MTHYPIKILMAFGCTFESEGDEFFEWLMRNGYPELGALSRTIQGDTKAKDWLMEHNFPQLAAIDSVIDKEEKAEQWLLKLAGEKRASGFHCSCRQDSQIFG